MMAPDSPVLLAPDDPVAAFHPRSGAVAWGAMAAMVIAQVIISMTLSTWLDKLVYVLPLTTHRGHLHTEIHPRLVAAAMLGTALALFAAYRLARSPVWLAAALWLSGWMIGSGAYGPNWNPGIHVPLPWLAKNLAWAAGTAVVVMGPWVWFVRPRWHRAILTVVLAWLNVHAVASAVYVFDPLVVMIQVIGPGAPVR